MIRLLLITFLLCLIRPPVSAAADAGEPTPTAAPSPPPTVIQIPLELFFRRPARILPVKDREKTEVAEEVPWLTDRDFDAVSVHDYKGETALRIYLTPTGEEKYREAMMGNVGRTILLTIGGSVRNAFTLVPVERKNRIHLVGNFTREEAEIIAEEINTRPSPSPSPRPLPTPDQLPRIIID